MHCLLLENEDTFHCCQGRARLPPRILTVVWVCLPCPEGRGCGNSNSQRGKPDYSYRISGTCKGCPPPWTFLPSASVSLGLGQAGISRHWQPLAKREHLQSTRPSWSLTRPKTTSTMGQSCGKRHQGAKELWKLGSNIHMAEAASGVVCLTPPCGPCHHHSPGQGISPDSHLLKDGKQI